MRRWRTLTRRGGAHKVRFITTQASYRFPRGDLMKAWRIVAILSLLLLPSGAMAALAAELPRLVFDRVWERKLRKGVKCHNGEEFNAESVKFSLERVKDAKLRASSNFRPIDHVEIVDPYTARVH